MKEATRKEIQSSVVFTNDVLQKLKDAGYKFVKIEGYTHDNRLDYMEPRYMLLTPTKEENTAGGEMGVYEPIDSEILLSWVEGKSVAKVFVAR